MAVNIVCDIKARPVEIAVERDGDPREWPVWEVFPRRNRDLFRQVLTREIFINHGTGLLILSSVAAQEVDPPQLLDARSFRSNADRIQAILQFHVSYHFQF